MHDTAFSKPVPTSANLPSSPDPVLKRRGRRSAASVVPTPPAVPQYITEGELSRMTTLSRTGLQAMRSRGEGPPYARLGHRIVYRLADVERWIEARTQRADNGQGAPPRAEHPGGGDS